MAKIRVYELARELNMESKALLAKMKALDIEVASHQSTLTDKQVAMIRKGETGVDDNKPKVVVRRRKKDSEGGDYNDLDVGLHSHSDEEELEHRAVAEESSHEDQQIEVEENHSDVKVTVANEENELVEVAPIEEKIKIEEKVEVEVPVVVKTVSEVKVEAVPVVSKQQATIVRKAEVKVEDKPVVESQPMKPKFQGGATIVRKATREEVSNNSQQHSQQSHGQHRRPYQSNSNNHSSGQSNHQSHSGQNSSAGYQQGRAPERTSTSTSSEGFSKKFTAEKPQRDPEFLNFQFGDESGKFGGKQRIKSKEVSKFDSDEEEKHKIKAAALLKGKKRIKSTRELLAGLGDEEGDAELPINARKKTVYTPTGPGKKKEAKRRKELKSTEITTPRASYRIVKMQSTITVGDLAMQMSIKSGDLIKRLMSEGMMATINQTLDMDTATLIAGEYGFEVKSVVKTVDDILQSKTDEVVQYEETSRSPIVTIMGHVDHGKTSILDALRQSGVAAQEAGGITQHIGAYTVVKDGKSITFLDTPGHEAFSAMRSRGAGITDIVVLVVAADDGVMPQTIEAISHARSAGVPIIVAVNKIDKPNQNLDRVYAELAEHGVQSEDWGGENQFVKTSALQKIGLDELLDAIQLQAEILELKAAPTAPGEGAVVEAHMEKGFGAVATILVTNGSVKKGDYIVAGQTFGRVRAMVDEKGKNQYKVGPSTPVRIIGLPEVPMAGDKVNVVLNEKVAKEIATLRSAEELARGSAKSSAQTLEDLLNKVKTSDIPEVPIIIKADTQGSVEAICETISKLNTDGVKNRVIHKAVGGINESDLSLAQTSGAVILGFNVRAGRILEDKAERGGVLINYFSIIYELVDTVKSLMSGKLPPIQTEVILGHAEIRNCISVPKVGTIAGSGITDGKITRNSQIRLIRDNIIIFTGKIGSLRRFKDDVKEVLTGFECGIGIDGYNDLKVGDIIEAFIIEETAATL